MDGTLLDLRFDNWFWQELIPSSLRGRQRARRGRGARLLAPKFVAVRGTLQWYCIEYWTRELKLDIAGIKREALAK